MYICNRFHILTSANPSDEDENVDENKDENVDENKDENENEKEDTKDENENENTPQSADATARLGDADTGWLPHGQGLREGSRCGIPESVGAEGHCLSRPPGQGTGLPGYDRGDRL